MNADKYKHHEKQLASLAHRIRHKYKVSIGELTFLASFLVNFVVGKLIHFTSQKEEVYNYYNDKNNVFNQLFVKRGWFWTTVVMAAFYGSVFYGKHPQLGTNRFPVAKNAIISYTIATAWWILFTQWCFGVPIMDKIFLWTGGRCVSVAEDRLAHHSEFFNKVEDLYESTVVGSKVCRQLRGNWEGGHDPSGHVFLLIHSSLYMFFETVPFWRNWTHVRTTLGKLKQDLSVSDNRTITVGRFFLHNPWIPVGMLILLWWFMLLMTNVYFHSILEKLVGLLFGYAISLVYLLPRRRATTGGN
ncbi:hypothetical protein CANTEDRAFT_114941 [Yamadazyma tenuis ATCC 10573]|nr:uncharacterized protein CANTEDRAFT_114941 [Yamadazyma tenuis ATCC 10573]EGV62537.1 hypothetical protein CANTEDRAFT_114941 [Yamadazyma tenuis ATCC 10573]